MLLHKLPTIIAMSWRQSFGVSPTIRVDYRLYQQLVAKCPTSQVVAEENDPIVTFEDGPIDGVLGSFTHETKTVMIDALEIMAITLDRTEVFEPEDFRRRFDEHLTQVLAHEGGHWHLEKKSGAWARWEKYIIFTVLLLVGLAGFFAIGWLVTSYINTSVFGWIAQLPTAAAVIATMLVYGIEIYAMARYFVFAFNFWKLISFFITYKVCWHERFAREFEGNVKLDSEWEKVVVVEM